MEINENSSKSMKTKKHIWKPIENQWNTWKSMKTIKNQWKSMKISEHLWKSLENQWKAMNLYQKYILYIVYILHPYPFWLRSVLTQAVEGLCSSHDTKLYDHLWLRRTVAQNAIEHWLHCAATHWSSPIHLGSRRNPVPYWWQQTTWSWFAPSGCPRAHFMHHEAKIPWKSIKIYENPLQTNENLSKSM